MLEKYKIQEIRFLPMDPEEEFQSERAVRDYLETGLLEEDGRYYYRNRGIDLDHTDALVLFQYGGRIVGYGVFQTRVKEPYSDIYHGYNQFYADSVCNIEPITAEEFAKIDPTFRKFSRSMRKTDIRCLQAVCGLLAKKRRAYQRKHR